MTPAYIPRQAFQSIPQGPIPEAFRGFDSSKGSPFIQMMNDHGQLLADGSRELMGVKLLAPKASKPTAQAKPAPVAKPSAQRQLADRRFAAIQEQREQHQLAAKRAPLVAELDKLESRKGFGVRFGGSFNIRKQKSSQEGIGEGQ